MNRLIFRESVGAQYFILAYSLPQMKVYTFLKLSTQNWGGQIKGREGGVHMTKKVQFGPTQWWMCRTPYFFSSPPRFWVLGFAASVYFLSVETVILKKIVGMNLNQKFRAHSAELKNSNPFSETVCNKQTKCVDRMPPAAGLNVTDNLVAITKDMSRSCWLSSQLM